MPTLGINCYVHDAAASLVVDGKIIAAAEEERFTRKKHTGSFPVEAIRYCLKEAGMAMCDVRHVAFSFDPVLQAKTRFLHGLRYFPRTLRFARYSSAVFSPFFLKKELASRFPEARRDSFQLHHVNHHLTHAASAFFASGFERAAVLTVDGAGEWATALLAQGEGTRIARLDEIHYPHSLGFFYGALTQLLGFRNCFDEGKVMALAAYGRPRLKKEFGELIRIEPDGCFRLNLKYFEFHLGSSRWYSRKMTEILGRPRLPEEPLSEIHADIAATLQAVLEEAVLGLAQNLHSHTGLTDLCLAGGVALNCSAIGKLLENSPFQRIFVQPASGDAGTALGAALWVSHHEEGASRNGGVKNAYLGPSFNEAEIQAALSAEQIPHRCMPEGELEEAVAGLIAGGKTVGWFQGRMEFGPRALGARSILADPRNEAMRDHLNRNIKSREPFRPFGPSVLEEDARDFFELAQASPFMLFAARVRPGKAALVPAAVHADGTSRIQTVSKEQSPVYWKLIQAFKRRTGIPMVLNTSFNLKDEPIVCRPLDAVRSFKRSRLDFLAIGPFVAWRPSVENPPALLKNETAWFSHV